MDRSVLSRIGFAALLCLIAGATILPMAGCPSETSESTDAPDATSSATGTTAPSSSTDSLPANLRAAADSYLSELAAITGSLSGITNMQGVTEFASKAQPVMDKLKTAYETLSGATTAERSSLTDAYGAKFTLANTAFQEAAATVTANDTWNRTIGPLLEKVQTFAP